MYKTRKEFIAALGVAEMPALFGARFAETMAEYEKEGVLWLFFLFFCAETVLPCAKRTTLICANAGPVAN